MSKSIILYNISKRYLDFIRERKNFITYEHSRHYINFKDGGWQFISQECFQFLLEEKLIHSISNFQDSKYIYQATQKGLNHHLIYGDGDI